jgi:ABC-type branched-subunit amino acid transport system substrate-binding protein
MKKNLALAAALAVGLTGPAIAAGVTNTEILLGTHLDLSGPVAAGMPQLRNAMQMRLDEANEAGGVHGRKFRIVVEDNAGQPQTAVRAAEKLIRNDRVFAMVQPFGSGANFATVKRTVDSGTMVFAPWGTSDALRTASGDSKYLFTLHPNYDTTTAAALAWAIKEFGAKKVGYIYMEGAFGDSVRKGVDAAMKTAGMTLAAEAGYKAGDIDFSSQVARMRAAGVDLVYIATIIRETVGIMAEVKKVGWNDAKVMTTFAGRTQLAIMLGKDAVEGLYGVSAWKTFNPANPTPEFKTWSDKFKAKFNLAPDENAAVAYAYTDWFVRGVQAAGRDLTSDKLVTALQGITYDNVAFYGPKSFVKNQAEPQTIRVEQIRGGAWVPVTAPIMGAGTN